MKDLLTQQTLITSFLEKRPRYLSALSFVNLFLWKDHFSFDIEPIDGNLCIFAKNSSGTFLYWPPLGEKISAQAVKECFQRMSAQNAALPGAARGSQVGRIENVSSQESGFFTDAGYQAPSRGEELYYHRPTLVSLQGEYYKSKRSSYNQFIKSYPFRYLPYSPSMLEECCRLYQDWMMERKTKSSNEIFLAMLEENQAIHRLGMQYAQELGLIGRVVEVDGRIRAYTFGYRLTDKIFCVLFEVADLSVKGLPTFIFLEFSDDPQVQPFPFINVMEDFEMENVTKTKLSFAPTMRVSIHTVTESKIS